MLDINTTSGAVRGFLQDGVRKFWGIPYCLAPVGERRFQPADPAVTWEGVLEATQHGPIAPQGTSDLDAPMGPVTSPQSEDCLRLNVTAPTEAKDLPVAVWFHGGANCYGAGDLDWYDPATLVKTGNLVAVNVNYRLGALGYLCHPDVNEENLAIGDMICALRWVQKNIAAFGGDPKRVTVFGQSAGGNAIVHMMALPETEGLFSAVILQSPSVGRGNHRKEDAHRVANCLVSHLGGTPETTKSTLMGATADEILQAMEKATAEIGADYGLMLFRPVKDAWHTPQQTIEAAASEMKRRKLPVMIGTTRDELHAFITGRDPETLEKIKTVQADRFDKPAYDFALAMVDAGCPVWKYRFDWQAPNSIYDSCHCIELPFVFGSLKAWENAPMLSGMDLAEGERLQSTLQAAWAEFIHNHGFNEKDWPSLNRQDSLHKVFDNQSNPIASIRF